MENELILQQFDEIEQKVERLIGALASLEATNRELTDKVGRLEQALEEKIEAEKTYNEERGLIRSKIDGLLIRLEEIAETE